MSPDVYQWFLAVHVFSFLIWVGSLIGTTHLVFAIQNGSNVERPTLIGLARRTAMSMDLGALLAIASGLWLAVGGPINRFTTGGWLHAKLTAVVLLILVPHVLLRIKVGRYRRDQQTGKLPGLLFGLILLGAAAAIVLVEVRPF